MPLVAGTNLGPYEILSLIATGGMGDVYRARDTRLHRIVAVKISRKGFGVLEPVRNSAISVGFGRSHSARWRIGSVGFLLT